MTSTSRRDPAIPVRYIHCSGSSASRDKGVFFHDRRQRLKTWQLAGMGSSAPVSGRFPWGEQGVAVCSAGRSHPAQPAERSSVTLPLSTTSVNLTQRQEARGQPASQPSWTTGGRDEWRGLWAALLPALLLLINYCFFLHGVRCGEESNHIQGQGCGVVWSGDWRASCVPGSGSVMDLRLRL